MRKENLEKIVDRTEPKIILEISDRIQGTLIDDKDDFELRVGQIWADLKGCKFEKAPRIERKKPLLGMKALRYFHEKGVQKYVLMHPNGKMASPDLWLVESGEVIGIIECKFRKTGQTWNLNSTIPALPGEDSHYYIWYVQKTQACVVFRENKLWGSISIKEATKIKDELLGECSSSRLVPGTLFTFRKRACFEA